MEKEIRETADNIAGSSLLEAVEVSENTKHAIRIAEIALSAFTGELRNKALSVASAIADFDDELNRRP